MGVLDSRGKTSPAATERGPARRAGERPCARISPRAPSPPATRPFVSASPEQGRNLLRDGTIAFGGTGELLPDGRAVSPHRPAAATA
ncbi:DUF5999 family protein [Streptomyces sp900105755]|uniref:DUF5999 family protein n=1 Tax=Streptomyces sp. 900105755 TaxID=3154389 RepID=UPI0033319700